MVNPKVCVLSSNIPQDEWVRQVFPCAFPEYSPIEGKKDFPFYYLWRNWEKGGKNFPLKEHEDLAVDFIGPYSVPELPVAYIPNETTLARCIEHAIKQADLVFVHLPEDSPELLVQLGFALGCSSNDESESKVVLSSMQLPTWIGKELSDEYFDPINDPGRLLELILYDFCSKWEYD